ncbi:hypothetical protein LJF28_03265 [Chryseobacterium indologenes]|uniref:DUF6056 family protein n=1 Tax=Chryseobacterium indologenes TaxID=253 RepID=UPI001D0D6D51|nr:DUF6056 family protein [Chryseobacterium indologenes]UDQ54699.1 hypothetical protein LJF28_03265 [Chryseobacterium indologenes]
MKTVQNIVLFLSIIVCIGLIYINLFNVYQTDDYIWAYHTRKLGLTGNFKQTYMHWGGRYFGYSINMFNPVFYDNNGLLPKIYPVFLMLSFIGVIALNCKEYFKYSFGESLQKAIMFFFFYTVLLISIPEHYFWITGSNIYFVPTILAGLLLYFARKNEETGQRIWAYLSLLLIIVLIGSNEIMALLLEGLLLLFYFQKRTKQNLAFLIVGTLFLLLSFLAPGNFSRMGDAQEGILKWIKRIGAFGANTIYIAFKVFLMVPLFIKVFEKELTVIRNKIPFRKALLIGAVSLFPLLFTGYIVNTIARQFESIAFYSLVTLSLILAFRFERIKKLWWVSLIVLFTPELKIFPEKYSNFDIDYNLANITAEVFTTDLKGYEKEINTRVKILKNTPGDSVVVDKIKHVPRVLYFDEMASVKEEETYVNDQLQKYFNKKYIRTKE